MNHELIKWTASCLCGQWSCLNNALSVGDNDRWLESVRGKDETLVGVIICQCTYVRALVTGLC